MNGEGDCRRLKVVEGMAIERVGKLKTVVDGQRRKVICLRRVLGDGRHLHSKISPVFDV